MEETLKVTGKFTYTGEDESIDFELEVPLRPLFAAFALGALVGLNLDEATHETDACYALNAADAMIDALTAEDSSIAAGGSKE